MSDKSKPEQIEEIKQELNEVREKLDKLTKQKTSLKILIAAFVIISIALVALLLIGTSG
tara:strand:+ start:96 stop:272 length:177 start_codon:yes stop_codon:yes gene_type:complete